MLASEQKIVRLLARTYLRMSREMFNHETFKHLFLHNDFAKLAVMTQQNPQMNENTWESEQSLSHAVVSSVESNEEKTTGPSKSKAKKSRHNPELHCKGIRLRLLPTPKQACLLAQWIGSSRYVWNWALNQYTTYSEQYFSDLKNNIDVSARNKTLSSNVVSQNLTQLRKQTKFAWLEAVPRTVLTNALQHLKASFSAYYNGLAGKRKGEPPGKPKFRSRLGSNETACFQIDPRHKNPLNLDNQTLTIPGLGPVSVVFSEPIVGDISSISVKRKRNKWFVSLSLINVPEHALQRQNKSHLYQSFLDPKDNPDFLKSKTGLAAFDASVVSGAVATSDGKTTYSLFNQAVLRSDERAEKQREKLQRVYSRKQELWYNSAGIYRTKTGAWPKDLNKILAEKGKKKKSKRMEDVQKRLAVMSLHELFRKMDGIHKFTTDLVRNHHTIVVETLDLKEMAQSKLGRKFRRRMHEACMGEIVKQLKYKCAWHNRTLIFADQWFASSKRCSNTACHQKYKELKVGEDKWTCTHCKTFHLRDDNASFNLWQEGWRLLEEFFQQNNTNCLAAGSVVRGAQGVVFESVLEKPKIKNNKQVLNVKQTQSSNRFAKTHVSA